jgi:hypothetical protein
MSARPFARSLREQFYHGAQALGVLGHTRAVLLPALTLARLRRRVAFNCQNGTEVAVSGRGRAHPLERPRTDRDLSRAKPIWLASGS